MNILTKILAGLCIVILTGLLLTLHLYSGEKGNYLILKDMYDQQLAVNNLTRVAFMAGHHIVLSNIRAKQTEHINVKTIIKTVLKEDECAATSVPGSVTGRLQQYERDIRARAGGAGSGSSSR
ncbi:hypothetical protein [Morganella morganii]|uniref:hypothetical protein n=1 Tax=Morganella morganii TaxID=582 RepID=UPI001BDA0DF8|nr:hypothetical protein [Morganella morganii]MBT0309970.1 hypothetical protein [Morganella morganii subsp. morganii]